MGGDPRPALRDGGLVPGPTAAAGPIIGALAQLPQSLAVGMNFAAAVGGLGLVVIGVAVGLYFAQRRREFEFASLRAMGTEPRQVSRVLLLEQGLMIVFAIGAGAAMSRPIAANARSIVSVAVHIANRKPPCETYRRISSDTAFFSAS